ncbi:g_PROTEIN_RECEP_F2_3 domain-containing protein [Nephila pilipes]|uniref:G_PROTEIN_RECEP_F2_3 domain-containing protein n=1 Tax=Nephila pilipes TaxID=299642 RepID=A0A8X6QG19_NEPPI|nr:g_PROTEIN_RECEP_F2_3 domain-containing protein [Nephila pilipes]
MKFDTMTDEESPTTIYSISEELPLEEMYCSSSYLNQINITDIFCNATWDGLSCWPATLAGTTATISCFPEFNGVKYDVSGNSDVITLYE